ncbi:MAG: PIN domain-containing protein [Snowella sp.]|nr:PIN domain-containing protein [Snowella sp.]
MTQKVKIIILDANILLRAILGIRTFSLIAEHTDKILFCTPEICYREVALHIPNIAKKRHLSPLQEQEALRTLNDLKQLVREIGEDIYGGFRQEALNRIQERDKKDWPVVALALAFGCSIWTEDQDFFGTGIATWRTKNIEFFFNE